MSLSLPPTSPESPACLYLLSRDPIGSLEKVIICPNQPQRQSPWWLTVPFLGAFVEDHDHFNTARDPSLTFHFPVIAEEQLSYGTI